MTPRLLPVGMGPVENPYQAPAADPPPLPTYSLQGLQPLYPLAAAALWICAGSLGFEVIHHGVQTISGPASAIGDAYQGPTPLEWGMLVLGLASTVPYLMWKYRAMANATRIDPAGVTVSPAMAVGSYFIPFVNLYVPFKAMAQIAKVSTGSTRGVAAWWATQVGSFLFAMVIGFIQSAPSPDRPGILDHLYIILSVLTVVAAWKLMMNITRAQMAGRQSNA